MRSSSADLHPERCYQGSRLACSSPCIPFPMFFCTCSNVMTGVPQVSMDKYQEWIQLVAEFTVNSLNSWQWASGSIHYLLGLWSRLVSSSAYLKGESPSLLETYAPKIIQAYVSSRCAH